MTPKQELIDGCRVLEKDRSNDSTSLWVVLCELPKPEAGFEEGVHRYVVWYVDHRNNASSGSYHETLNAAMAVFEDRT